MAVLVNMTIYGPLRSKDPMCRHSSTMIRSKFIPVDQIIQFGNPRLGTTLSRNVQHGNCRFLWLFCVPRPVELFCCLLVYRVDLEIFESLKEGPAISNSTLISFNYFSIINIYSYDLHFFVRFSLSYRQIVHLFRRFWFELDNQERINGWVYFSWFFQWY